MRRYYWANAPGEAEIPAQAPTIAGTFYSQAVLQRRGPALTSAEIDRASAGIRASSCGGESLLRCPNYLING